MADKYIIVCSSVFCTVWDLPIGAPSRMHCRQSLEGRSHFLPPAVKYSVRPGIIWDSFQGLALFKYAGNNGQGIKWSTASPSKGSRGFESTASWSAVYIVWLVIGGMSLWIPANIDSVILYKVHLVWEYIIQIHIPILFLNTEVRYCRVPNYISIFL